MRGFGWGRKHRADPHRPQESGHLLPEVRPTRHGERCRAWKQAYYDLHYAVENVKVKELSVDLARRFLDESRKRMEVGTMARLDVVQAEAELSQREGDLIDAQRQFDEAEIAYKQLISRDVLTIHDVLLVPVDRPSVVAMRD